MPAHYRKRDGQIYLQTWHGTPLKRIGFDIERPQFVSGSAYLDHLAEDVAHWDLLLSQNPFSTPILRRAFRFDGEICEYGYPRNDILSRPDAPQLAAAVRSGSGSPPASGSCSTRPHGGTISSMRRAGTGSISGSIWSAHGRRSAMTMWS